MNYRSSIREFIIRLEQTYPINSYKLGSVHLWPLIRIRLFFYLIFQSEKHSQTPPPKQIGLISRVNRFVDAAFLFLKIFVSKKHIAILYSGSYLHRIDFHGKSFNRFFDVLLDAEETERQMLIAEYHEPQNKPDYYRPDRILEAYKLYPLFFRITNVRGLDSDLEPLRPFMDILEREVNSSFSIKFNKEFFLKSLKNELTKIFVYKKIYGYIFKRFRVDKAVGLCYYNTPLLGMNLAARERNIPVADYQHGPQGINHLSYSSWSNVPRQGYALLPSLFYCWSKVEVELINGWASATMYHSALVAGNSWVEHWKKFDASKGERRIENIILFTLQPLEEAIEPYVIDAIKQTSPFFHWWLRLHPRQFHDKAKIYDLLERAGISRVVNIEDASTLPLPEILLKSKLHITRFSGSFLEATEFRVPSILIDERGKESFNAFIDSKLHRIVLDKTAASLVDAIDTLISTNH